MIVFTSVYWIFAWFASTVPHPLPWIRSTVSHKDDDDTQINVAAEPIHFTSRVTRNTCYSKALIKQASLSLSMRGSHWRPLSSCWLLSLLPLVIYQSPLCLLGLSLLSCSCSHFNELLIADTFFIIDCHRLLKWNSEISTTHDTHYPSLHKRNQRKDKRRVIILL